MVSAYKIILSDDPEELAKEVERLCCDEQWFPQGGVSIAFDRRQMPQAAKVGGAQAIVQYRHVED